MAIFVVGKKYKNRFSSIVYNCLFVGTTLVVLQHSAASTERVIAIHDMSYVEYIEPQTVEAWPIYCKNLASGKRKLWTVVDTEEQAKNKLEKLNREGVINGHSNFMVGNSFKESFND